MKRKSIIDMTKKIDSLIKESDKYPFESNSILVGDTTYAKASSDMHAWIAECVDFIKSNYDEGSSPVKILNEFNMDIFITTYGKVRFDKHKDILISALKACKRVQPNRVIINKYSEARSNVNANKKMTLNEKIGLVTLLFTIGGSLFMFGKYFGENRFDERLINSTQENQILKQDTAELKKLLINANETIINLKKRINTLPNDSISVK